MDEPFKVLTVPRQIGLCQYTGLTLTPEWDSYNPEYMEISGTTSATNAGRYVSKFTPKDGYMWSDGSSSEKSILWEIEKGYLDFSLSQYSIDALLNVDEKIQVFVSSIENINIIASSSDTDVVTCGVSDDIISIYIKGEGRATVTVAVDESKNYNRSENKSIDVIVRQVSPKLDENSFDDIIRIADKGLAEKFFKVGDFKKEKLTNGNDLTLEIVDFNHDDKSDGSGKANVTFGTKYITKNSYRWNSPRGTTGGYTQSDAYKELTNNIYNLIPENIRTHIKTVTKKYVNGPEYAAQLENTDVNIFLFSSTELGLTQDYEEGSAYSYFSTNSSRMKTLSDGTKNKYWTSSLEKQNIYYAYTIGTDGRISKSYTDTKLGFVFGFCI